MKDECKHDFRILVVVQNGEKPTARFFCTKCLEIVTKTYETEK